MPPAPLHNAPVPFFYWQLQEPDAKVRKIIPPWQGTSGSLANSEDHCVNQPLRCWSWLYNEVVCELAQKACSSRHLLSAGGFSTSKIGCFAQKTWFLESFSAYLCCPCFPAEPFASLRPNHISAMHSGFFFPRKRFRHWPFPHTADFCLLFVSPNFKQFSGKPKEGVLSSWVVPVVIAPEDRRDISASRSYSWARWCSLGLSFHVSVLSRTA